MSQVAAKKKLQIKNEKVFVTGHFHEQGSVLKGDAEGYCDGFDVEITLESDENSEVIAELIRLSRRMCFTDKALTGNTPVRVTQKVNGLSLELEG